MVHIENLKNCYSMYNEKLNIEISLEEYYKLIKCETYLIWTTLTQNQKEIYKNNQNRLFEVLLLTDKEFQPKRKKICD